MAFGLLFATAAEDDDASSSEQVDDDVDELDVDASDAEAAAAAVAATATVDTKDTGDWDCGVGSAVCEVCRWACECADGLKWRWCIRDVWVELLEVFAAEPCEGWAWFLGDIW